MTARNFLRMANRRAERPRKLGNLLAVGLASVYASHLVAMFRAHAWILNASGQPLVTNYLMFWLSGKSALTGNAHAAYDPDLLHAAQEAAAGYKFSHYLLWNYPPHYFFFAAAFAALPYLPAFLTWIAGTLGCYVAAIACAARSRIAALVGCAAPAVFINALSGENGCLTAALLSAFLVLLEEHPALSGVVLGLLTIKPHLGILVPILLVATGKWRTLASAFFTAILCLTGSVVVFGSAALRGFIQSLPAASRYVLVNGTNGWHNIQSIYGLARWLGLNNQYALLAQVCIAAFAVLVLIWLWRQPLPPALKAAALALSSLLASPYLYIYDFVVLSVPLAFLYREHPFDALEIACVALANICVGAFLFFPSPIGLAGAAIVAAMIARRIVRAHSSETEVLPVAARELLHAEI
jgi:hypothetical protein